MLFIVKSLEIFTLLLQESITGKPLPAKEFSVVGIVKMFNNTITPRFSNGNKHWLNAVI
jgi:hypothetical protein